MPLIVDNTVATPDLCRPFELGADIVVHSLTKYIGGHGTTIGGAIVDSGKFDWVANKERCAILNEPDPSYHGGVEACSRFIDSLEMILRLVNIGDAKSLGCHPASTTHRQLNPEELAFASVRADLIRISVAIEHLDDIIADVSQALEKA